MFSLPSDYKQFYNRVGVAAKEVGSWTFKYHQKDRPGKAMCPSNDTTPHSRMIRRKNSLDTVTAVWVLCNYTSTTCVCVVSVDGLWKLEEKKNGVVDRYLSNHHDDDKHVLCCSLYIGTSWFQNWSEQKLWRR